MVEQRRRAVLGYTGLVLFLIASCYALYNCGSAAASKVAVFVIAHQDDETLSMGAAIVGDCNAGYKVYVLLCTDGGASGVWDPNEMSHDAFCKARYAELVGASRALGAVEVMRVRASGPSVGWGGLFKDSSLNLGVVKKDGAASAGYYGNDLGPAYSHVNEALCGSVEASLKSIAADNGIQTQQLRVGASCHMDEHPDHRAVCQAVLQLYSERIVSDVRLYLGPGQWAGSAVYAGTTFPGARELGVTTITPEDSLNRLDAAIACYMPAGTLIRAYRPVCGESKYGIGYRSVESSFDSLHADKCSYRCALPTIKMD